MGLIIRDAAEADFEAIQMIYAHHVLHGTGSFEEQPPDIEDMLVRFRAVRANGLCWLVAEDDGGIAGYAYAQRFHSRSGWRRTLEDSVYVAPGRERQGLGRALLAELVSRCSALDYGEMVAVIGDSDNLGSIHLHASAGFVHAGMLKNVGLKFGRRLDVVYMQRSLE
jgi:L-amino acid N-acyltransferase YncA